MSIAKIYNWKKEEVGNVELPSTVFEIAVKNEVLHSVVHWQLASRRQGTHSTKTKGYVRGGGKKPFKQKGTGNARQGSSRSPLMPGGGKVFGPLPRSYSYALPKKIRNLALKMALSHLNKEGKLFVVDSMSSDQGKTKELLKRLENFGVQKALIVDENVDLLFRRASNNLQSFKYVPVQGMNVYDLLKFDTVLLTEKSIEKVVERCVGGSQ